MTGVLVAGLLAATLQTRNPEASDGFYCATARYFAYETLLHTSTAPHLLHVVSLDDEAGARPELAIEIAAPPTTRIRCDPGVVALGADTATSVVRLNLGEWTARIDSSLALSPRETGGGWQSTRLWGTGSWTTSATQALPLRRYAGIARVRLEIVRVSTGGPYCTSNAGARLVWLDRSGKETRARAIFLRRLTCRSAGLDAGPVIDDCAPQPGRVLRTFSGRVNAGGSFARDAAPFRVELKADGDFGWTIRVRPLREDRDLMSLIPRHGSSSRDIQPPPAQVPAERVLDHPFHFHPEIGRSIVDGDDSMTMLVDDLRVEAYGRGRLRIERYSLGRDAKGQPRYDWIEFSGCLSWPR